MTSTPTFVFESRTSFLRCECFFDTSRLFVCLFVCFLGRDCDDSPTRNSPPAIPRSPPRRPPPGSRGFRGHVEGSTASSATPPRAPLIAPIIPTPDHSTGNHSPSYHHHPPYHSPDPRPLRPSSCWPCSLSCCPFSYYYYSYHQDSLAARLVTPWR